MYVDCRYGITAGALLKAKTSDWRSIPPEALHLAYHPSEDDNHLHDKNKSNVGNYEVGGWRVDELAFPGYKGQCEMAELDGRAVIEDPATMVEHFLLTKRPVIIRDFIRHDKEV
jgi:hypothetical protein